ncbi:PEP-CTERM sorting domain-containing protein [Nitrosospira sp. Is2]|uniref:PEP-CTERM sorting domain-containing protein n=1 Tax=Nitrosospira sp. Is2 TaxID=3080532 RepID=UPI00295385A0|nr:PEP-CTERM sorting domain-containing protein [Nitrosospira sp. Is2]WON74412.1 PEP-CTERM sorting domain-containing protein [Nitrosospira sp. Is2]
MTRYFRSTKMAAALAALGFMSLVGSAQGALLQIDFTKAGAFSGTSPTLPSDPNAVFARAIFDDHGGSGSVTLTMTVLNNLSAGAYVNDWYFNVGSAPLTGISFTSGVAAPNIDNGTNAFKADGTGGNFDFAFHFNTRNPGSLGQGFSSVYTLTDPGITANSFNSISISSPINAGNGGYLSAIHVQGYGNSVWIAGDESVPQAQIPEPATLALIGLGLIGIAANRRRWS